jgi:transglutaminase-like putative cysteine protease
MKQTLAPPPVRWWDWTSVVLVFLLLQTIAARLTATEWTPSLNMIRGFTSMGIVIGLALGYSVFSPRKARWLSFFYMLLLLPLQWTEIIAGPVALEEKLSSIGGRLLFSLSELFARRPVDDPLFFVAIMSVAFWIVSASAGYQLTRHQNFLTVTLPSLIGILVIQNYDNAVRGRMWIMAFFVLFALLLLGRLTFLQEQKRWKDKRIFLSPENSLDLTGGMAIAAALLILTAWTAPASFIKIDTARQAWNRITKPWSEFTNRFENAVSALESQGGGKPGDFYGAQLELGLGLPLSEEIMFTVEAPDLPVGQKPPRYYWRGKVYDYYQGGNWSATGTRREEYSPNDPLPAEAGRQNRATFTFKTGVNSLALLYAPAQTIWVSRPGSRVKTPAGVNEEILSWSASPGLLPGESFQVEAVVSNPNIAQLRAAGTAYPQWVTDKYLQLPEGFSPRIRELAGEIAAMAGPTPYDKAETITRYLRENIKYSATVPESPLNADRLEWVLFEYKQGYCVYYASAEILMLRALGIPARMAVGFAQGTGISTRDGAEEQIEESAGITYTVRKKNAHAWPEVYFPGVGWVEFEPTGNQEPLDRPQAPRDGESAPGFTNPNLNANPEDANSLRDQSLPDEQLETPVEAASPRLLLVYVVPIFLALATLAVFLNRRYALPVRLPSLIRTSIERGGTEIPRWVLHWERWVQLSPVEKAFESVNFALRQLNEPLPIHATPAERADKLVDILPQAKPSVKVLLDEHQTSLYTSRTADARQARRAALTVRFQVMLARLRHFWTGKYSPRL